MVVNCFETCRAIDFWNRRNQLNFPGIVRLEHHQVILKPFNGTWENSEKPENQRKNRYNIRCWDHNRVILKSGSGSTSNYIHANYVDGFEDDKKFIITQGPMEETCNDFWKAVWQNNCSIIVMLTPTKGTNGEELCYQYWSLNEDSNIITEDFVIETVNTSVRPTYILTTLRITDKISNDSRRISHYQYTEWPVDETPTNHVDFIKFIKIININRKKSGSNNQQQLLSPIVVHCSDGVKKTGIFCAVDISLNQLVLRKTVSLAKTAEKIRQQRHSTISTPDDYLYYNQVIMFYCIFYIKF
ncbi:protein tyrosine phosphatase N1 [Microplitis demolitor]|uniref:tyrosine-protein phosphatase non-receptor type 9 n=1 Tax=Microplitis demolitor TaxID=69319 RepID=UPI0004400342|nr:tyrosine-protein phosphatase non-receptor type 9 [Microplitis demolitor]KAG6558334.1 protein tyrosine phosphatase N1 [Microplitis demolitor]